MPAERTGLGLWGPFARAGRGTHKVARELDQERGEPLHERAGPGPGAGLPGGPGGRQGSVVGHQPGQVALAVPTRHRPGGRAGPWRGAKPARQLGGLACQRVLRPVPGHRRQGGPQALAAGRPLAEVAGVGRHVLVRHRSGVLGNMPAVMRPQDRGQGQARVLHKGLEELAERQRPAAKEFGVALVKLEGRCPVLGRRGRGAGAAGALGWSRRRPRDRGAPRPVAVGCSRAAPAGSGTSARAWARAAVCPWAGRGRAAAGPRCVRAISLGRAPPATGARRVPPGHSRIRHAGAPRRTRAPCALSAWVVVQVARGPKHGRIQEAHRPGGRRGCRGNGGRRAASTRSGSRTRPAPALPRSLPPTLPRRPRDRSAAPGPPAQPTQFPGHLASVTGPIPVDPLARHRWCPAAPGGRAGGRVDAGGRAAGRHLPLPRTRCQPLCVLRCCCAELSALPCRLLPPTVACSHYCALTTHSWPSSVSRDRVRRRRGGWLH